MRPLGEATVAVESCEADGPAGEPWSRMDSVIPGGGRGTQGQRAVRGEGGGGGWGEGKHGGKGHRAPEGDGVGGRVRRTTTEGRERWVRGKGVAGEEQACGS